jgi:hypothetical protein
MFGVKTSGAIVPTFTRRSILYGLACACCETSRSFATTMITGVLCATRTGSGLEVGTLLKTTGNPQLDKSLISEMLMQSLLLCRPRSSSRSLARASLGAIVVLRLPHHEDA